MFCNLSTIGYHWIIQEAENFEVMVLSSKASKFNIRICSFSLNKSHVFYSFLLLPNMVCSIWYLFISAKQLFLLICLSDLLQRSAHICQFCNHLEFALMLPSHVFYLNLLVPFTHNFIERRWVQIRKDSIL